MMKNNEIIKKKKQVSSLSMRKILKFVGQERVHANDSNE